MADLHNQKLKKNKLIPLKYSWDEANERRAQGLCIFCEEQETPLHHLKHKRLVLVIVGGDDDDDELSSNGVLDEKEISDRDSSTQDTQSSNGVLDENQVSETEPLIQELVLDDVSDPFSGEERILEAGSSILVTEETEAELNERMILMESLLLDNSWEVMKSGQTTEIHDLVHEDESYMVIGSDVRTYCSPQSQDELQSSYDCDIGKTDAQDELQSSYDCDIGKTDAVQMFDQMSYVITSREKYMRHLKSWKFKFKAREQAIKVLWKYLLGGKKCVDVLMQFHGCLNFIINPLKLESSSTIEVAAGLIRFVVSVSSHREFIAKSGASEEINVASEFGFEISKGTQSRVYVHERLSSSGQIIEREYKVLKLLDFKRGCERCSQDSKVAVKENILNLITKTVQMVKLEKDPHDAFALIIDRKTTLATGEGAIDVGMIQEADIGVDISGIGGMQAYSTVGTTVCIATKLPLKKAYERKYDWWSLGAITVRRRLDSKSADEIKVHPGFETVDWDTILNMDAIFVQEQYDMRIYLEAKDHCILFLESFLSWLVSQQEDLSTILQGDNLEEHKAEFRLVPVSTLITQAVDDVLSELLLVQVSLHHKSFSIQKWNDWRIMLLKKRKHYKDWWFKYKSMGLSFQDLEVKVSPTGEICYRNLAKEEAEADLAYV